MVHSCTWNWIKKITTHHWSFKWKIKNLYISLKSIKTKFSGPLYHFEPTPGITLKTKTPYNYSFFLHLAINNTKLMSAFLKILSFFLFPTSTNSKNPKIVVVIPNFLMRFSDFVSLLTRTWKSTWDMPRCKTGFLP